MKALAYQGLLLLGLLGLSGAIVYKKCLNCRYDSSNPVTVDCLLGTEPNTITCTGVCIVDHVRHAETNRDILVRGCSETTMCNGFRQMRFVQYGWGTRHCCDAQLCNSSGGLKPSTVFIFIILALINISAYL